MYFFLPIPPIPPINPGQFNNLESSTTRFSFGASTACVCNGQQVSTDLSTLGNGNKDGWVGVATPDWLLTPFLDRKGASANGNDTPTSQMGTTYYSNCGTGAGGCGTCWKLTTLSEPNINGSVPDKVYTANVVVVDACEDRNAYGNNWQWCVAAKGVSKGGINTQGYSGHGEGQPWIDKIREGVWDLNSDPKFAKWTNPDCYDSNGIWTCTNLAGKPLHFDLAINGPKPQGFEWPMNPIVKAEQITCPQEVLTVLKNNCGGNADKSENLPEHCFWCPQDPQANQGGVGSMPAILPDWWGGCGPDVQNPNCALMNTQCGGKDWTGPTCCQWGQTCLSDGAGYYSGCK